MKHLCSAIAFSEDYTSFFVRYVDETCISSNVDALCFGLIDNMLYKRIVLKYEHDEESLMINRFNCPSEIFSTTLMSNILAWSESNRYSIFF